MSGPWTTSASVRATASHGSSTLRRAPRSSHHSASASGPTARSSPATAGQRSPSSGAAAPTPAFARCRRVYLLVGVRYLKVRVVATKTRDGEVPLDYDASRFPAFAVTVDVVILTMSEGMLHVLLVCRGEAPFEGMWAIPGGFKRPSETLDEAAKRELAEE